ncbi:glycoside hydrolase family 71/99-like protein [Xylanibacter ruminicola]|uniref:Xylosidase n=1 Tax=Xylanibacter ruminicola TaxID=839 RepID=A0A1M6RZ64_XYLRU|nr:glycoside hydrolase family 71/99-like protein [Xylanibacter ruminicola]SHK37597.1 hypothetical protein SAMN05216463_102184 [Xylanibacter ruminicola]
MKCKVKLCGMLVVEAFIGLSIMACSGGGNDDYIPPAVIPAPPSNPGTTEPVAEYNSLGDGFKAHQEGEPYETYVGLVMCGYQGWFGTPGDKSPLTTVYPNEGWYHYRENEQFRPGVLRNSIDFWPDMSEYENKYVVGDGDLTGYSSPFVMPDGTHATVFSSYDRQTVMTHFKWMKQYNIDGAFMQRFVGEIMDSRHKDHFDVVLDNAMNASNEYQRAIAVMYDMSGITTDAKMRIMINDAQELMNKYKLNDRSKQKYYLYENGKPMLALWGAGFNDDNHPKPSFLKTYVDELKAQGWSIMLGCPGYWRQGGNDCVGGSEHTELIKLIKQCDAFIPWYVGRYGHDNFTNNDWQTRIKQDIATAKTYSSDGHRVVYAEHIFPGGSDRNMHPNNGKDSPDHTNTGFRFGGKFFWNQFYYDIKNGTQAIYVGMFDEMDEGTAIFKQLNVSKVPSNIASEDYYVNYSSNGSYSVSTSQRTGSSIQWSELASSLNICFQGIDDDKPTDYYLWLTGEGRKMLNGQIKMTKEIPTR